MASVGKLLERAGSSAALVCGYAVVVLSFLISVEVIARKQFNFSFNGVDEIAGYVVATIAPFAFTYALLKGAHTRIEILTSKVSTGARLWLDRVAMLALSCISVVILWYAVDVIKVSIKFKSVSIGMMRTPLWIPQLIWIIGLALFLLTAFYILAKLIITSNKPDEHQDRGGA